VLYWNELDEYASDFGDTGMLQEQSISKISPSLAIAVLWVQIIAYSTIYVAASVVMYQGTTIKSLFGRKVHTA
jgi:hypothetical protein